MIDIKNIKITPDILRKIADVDAFNGRWQGKRERLKTEELHSMKRIATIESVGSSNRIEGNKMTDMAIETLFENISRKSFADRDEEEVAGYADLLNTIFDNYTEIKLSENYIKQLHQIMLRYSTKDERHRGEYKTDTNRVVAFDSQGKEIGVIFETASAFDTPRLMAELVEWTNRNLADGYLHPLIVIGSFVVHFLAIHPFSDGNGRLSRALTILLMLQSGYEYMPYASMESVVEATKDSYYRALRRTQKNIWKDKVDYEPWLVYFLTSLQKQKGILEEKLINLNRAKKKDFSRVEEKIFDLFEVRKDWTVGEMSKELEISTETVRKAVYGMVDKGFLERKGQGRSTWYEKRI